MAEKSWFVFKRNHHQGPFSQKELVDLLARNELQKLDLIWREGQKGWESIGKMEWPLSIEREVSPRKSTQERPPHPPKASSRDFKEKKRAMPLESWLCQQTFELLEKKETQREFPPLPKQVKENSEKRPKTAIKEKKNLFNRTFSLKIGVLGALGVLLAFLGVSFFSPSLHSPSPLSSKLHPKALQNLNKAHQTPFKGGQGQFHLAMNKKGNGVYLATNYPYPARVFFTMTSLKKRLLGRRKVVITGQTFLKDGWAYFKRWKIKEGRTPLAGEYEVEIHGYHKDRDLSFKDFFQEAQTGIKGQADFYHKSKVLLYGGTQEDFLAKLKKFHLKWGESKVAPLQDCLQRYQSLLALLGELHTLYEGHFVGRSLLSRLFEKNYHQRIGPYLRDLVLSNNQLHLSFLNVDPEISRYYENLMNFGKNIGDLAARMLEKRNAGKKKTVLTKIKKLKNQGLGSINKLKREMADYQY